MTTILLFHVVISTFIYQGQGVVNFALNKSANQSSTLTYHGFSWTAEKAVDGNIDSHHPDIYITCSATRWTTSYQNHTWEVDIGFQIIVKTITVYGRTDPGDSQLECFTLSLGNTSGPWNYGQQLRSSENQHRQYVFEPGNVIARFISLKRWGNILVICEVTVEGECRRGNYGSGCNEICSNCYKGNNSCSLTDGKCMEGCEAGWRGDICKNECEAGTYGFNCNETCGHCLNGNNNCSKTSGQCSGGCQAGWKGETCRSECEAGTYGFNCKETCGHCLNGNNRCSKTSGQCSGGCQAGWKGETCKTECEVGTYGFNCNETCGYCLNGNNSCSKIIGQIIGQCSGGCQSGWRGETCKSECEAGTYGFHCNETCGYCLNGNNSCSKISGHCTVGCQTGWMAETSKSECKVGTYGFNCNETCGYCVNGNDSCSKISGQCTGGCQSGWRGKTCKSECEVGTYGFNCTETCGYCLKGNNICSKINGHCSGDCQSGWMGETCKSECEAGTYGFNCNETCGYCLNGNNSCSRIIGHCSDDCQTGWRGETCKSGTLGTVTTVDAGPNTGAIVGSVLAAVAVSIFAMVIIIVIVRNRRRKKHNNETSTDNVTTAGHHANMVAGNPDAVCKINARSITEKGTKVSAIEQASLQRVMPIGTTNNHSGVMESDVPVHNVYEKLQDVTESIESAYCTIDHNCIGYADDKQMESMEPSSTYVETLQSLESALKSVEEEISVLFDQKEKLLSKELETARANKLRDKWKKNDSDKDKDSTNVNFVQALQSIEGELRILEEKRKCLLGRKEILLRKELAKTTENEK